MLEGIYYKTEDVLEFKVKDVIHHIIQDLRSQFFGFEIMQSKTNIEEIKKIWIPRAVSEGQLKTLEEYITRYDSKHIDEITEFFLNINPNIFNEYDELIEGLKDPKLDNEKFNDILSKEKILLKKMENPE